MLHLYREEDAGDLRGIELHELVESMEALNALKEKVGKSRKVGEVIKVG